MLVFAIENKVSKFLNFGRSTNSTLRRKNTLCKMQTAFTIVSIKFTQNRYFAFTGKLFAHKVNGLKY